ncbi:MAG: acylphosphatase [Myxococcales bacterium]|nr:acylphosphatase [Myxococcales bacterium]
MRVRALVEGRVQGVGFRWAMRRRARSLGLTGFVRNLGDGRVEILFEGEVAAVREGLAFVRRGPPGSRVRNVDLHWEEPQQESAAFSVL